MLHPDKAQEQLEEWRIDNCEARRVTALRKLPKKLALAGLAFLHRDIQGKNISNWIKRETAVEEAAQFLDECSSADRKKVFGAFFPKLGGHLDRAWRLLDEAPYQAGWERKSFRAPSDPAVTRSRRREWFEQIVNVLVGYQEDVVDIEWTAAWAPHLGFGGADEVGILLAAALDAGGEEGDRVFQILVDSAKGDHDVGRMGRHVTRALLLASRPDGWEFMEKMLLAAQRQEGLRQVILETIDEAHPEAFQRMLKLILDENLVRFSSVVRAMDVWLGLQWDSASAGVVKEGIAELHAFFADKNARKEALENGSAESVYRALWTLAFEDAKSAVVHARKILQDDDVERRFAAVHLLASLHHPAAVPALCKAVEDPDLRVAMTAFRGLPSMSEHELEDEVFAAAAKPADDRFALAEEFLARLPKKAGFLDPLVWPWAKVWIDPQHVADSLVFCLGKQSVKKLLPYLPSMSNWGRRCTAERLKKKQNWDAETRKTMFQLVADRDAGVRAQALSALKKSKITAEEGRQLEAALKRKAADTRRAVLEMLIRQPTAEVEAGCERLLASSNLQQRLGGLEILWILIGKEKHVQRCRERAQRYKDERDELDEEERDRLEVILDPNYLDHTLDNALGLLGSGRYTPVVEPKQHKVRFLTPTAVECLKELDALIHEHRDEPIKTGTGEDAEEELLGNVGFPYFDRQKPIQEQKQNLPLLDLWEEWWADRPKKLRDPDGLELLRAAILGEIGGWDWNEWKKLEKRPDFKPVSVALTGGVKPPKLKYGGPVNELIDWLNRLHPPAGVRDYLLDAAETAFALVPAKAHLAVSPKKWESDWRHWNPFQVWLDTADSLPDEWTDAQKLRRWQMLHWADQPADNMPRARPDLEILLEAYKLGAANETDFLDELLGPEGAGRDSERRDFSSLSLLTMLKPHDIFKDRPEVKDLVERCKERILQIELKRGDTETVATRPALAIQSLAGADVLLRLLQRVGSRKLPNSYWGDGKLEVLKHLISVVHPLESDSPEVFAEKTAPFLKDEVFTEERLIELAFVAPQWVKHVEHFLEWEGFAEGVWWFHAHMNACPRHLEDAEDDFDFDDEVCATPKTSPWTRMLQERTTLLRHELQEGAVDVTWFQRVYPPLGPKKWKALAVAARYAGSGGSAKKAFYLSQVLLGKAKKKDLVQGIKVRNLRESVRLLGLLPLAKAEKRDSDLQNRYRILQGYRRYARSLGPLSREGALRTADIGLENLARTAGYPDPIRFEWEMEAREINDLAHGPIEASANGVTVTLRLDEQTQPEMTIRKGDKTLKSIPKEVKKNKAIAALVDRKTELKRQASRIRTSLEVIMCRGDAFTGAELQKLLQHPMLAPLLRRLVVVGESALGYPDTDGQTLRTHRGESIVVGTGEQLRLAHPHDLLASGEWHLWQKECFTAERVQPFKQIFRELYVVTAQEKKDGTASHRYTGQQVNPNQAQALFGARTWSTREGIEKQFYHAGLTAEVSIRFGGFSPLDVEGWTIEDVQFRKRGAWDLVPLKDVPPTIFSEVMRDLDLVVSVAHLGGVDPEASASTVEMRTALLRETCEFLKLDNVKFKSNHALIEGQLANYTIHLGSGVVHRQPGGHLCIVPVHAQHRGRLFLPFADDDPRTAEVTSKVLLLARDHEIQDPSILEQLRGSS